MSAVVSIVLYANKVRVGYVVTYSRALQ